MEVGTDGDSISIGWDLQRYRDDVKRIVYEQNKYLIDKEQIEYDTILTQQKKGLLLYLRTGLLRINVILRLGAK
jgi:hypothetical protein